MSRLGRALDRFVAARARRERLTPATHPEHREAVCDDWEASERAACEAIGREVPTGPVKAVRMGGRLIVAISDWEHRNMHSLYVIDEATIVDVPEPGLCPA